MGNSKNRRLAGELLKSYSLPKKHLPTLKRFSWTSRSIISFLSLKHGDLVYDDVTNENHRVIGFIADYDEDCTVVLHLVYDDHSVGSDAFGYTAAQENTLLHSGKQSPLLYNLENYNFTSFVPLKKRDNEEP